MSLGEEIHLEFELRDVGTEPEPVLEVELEVEAGLALAEKDQVVVGHHRLLDPAFDLKPDPAAGRLLMVVVTGCQKQAARELPVEYQAGLCAGTCHSCSSWDESWSRITIYLDFYQLLSLLKHEL